MSLWRKKEQINSKFQIKISINVVVEPDDDGFHAYAPALKGLHVDGKTEAKTLKHARQAIICYLASLAFHGDPLPARSSFR